MLRPSFNKSLITQINTGLLTTVIRDITGDISKAVAESTPVSSLIAHGASIGQIKAIVAALITKYANMLSVGGNLKQGQSIEFADMLLEEYPTASLDDINIMLSRGVKGRYGDIFRFDVSVLFSWMKLYQAEWAEEKEKQHKKEKTTETEIDPDFDPKNADFINSFLNNLQGAKMESVRSLTPEEIKKEGKERPPRKKAMAYIPKELTEEDLIIREKRIEWMLESTDKYTGKMLPGALSFEEWIKR